MGSGTAGLAGAGITAGVGLIGGSVSEANKGSYGTPDAKAQSAQRASVAADVRNDIPVRTTSAGIGFNPRRP